MNQTLLVLQAIATQVGNRVSVIELLNEIAGFLDQQWANAARQFWQEGYHQVRAAAGNNVKIMIGDAFLGVNNWYGYMTPPDYEGVLMDLVSHGVR
jgi:glucan 1,3-beta-glucosidase